MYQQFGADLRLLCWIKNNTGHFPHVFSDLKNIKRLDSSKTNRPNGIENEKLPTWIFERHGDFSLIGEMSRLHSLRINDIETDDYSFISDCKSLRSLDLRNTNFSDCSLLNELSVLERVSLPFFKGLKNTHILKTLSAKIEIEEPFYHDEEFSNMVIVKAEDVVLSYEGNAQVQYVEVSFIGQKPLFWQDLAMVKSNWARLETEKSGQLIEQLIEEILRGNVRNMLFSLEPWGEEHFLTIDIANGWAAAVYNDDEGGIYFNSYNNNYSSVEQLAPVNIGGQTPVPKLFALMDMELVGGIVEHFLKNGQFYPGTLWVKHDD